MRLIDADSIKFIEYINGDITVSKQAIQNMPTAYDADKVVEQLESVKTNFIGMGTIQSAYFDKGIDKAIEIVKSGGVADD